MKDSELTKQGIVWGGVIFIITLVWSIWYGWKTEEVPIAEVYAPVHTVERPDLTDESVVCLAMNIYHEARSDNYAGQVAVADVTMNRVKSPRFPNTVCEVVHEAKLSEWHLERGQEVPIRHKCQFSWFCDGLSDRPKDEDTWQQSLLLAHNVLVWHEHRGITEGATHYHATYVLPRWSKDRNMKLVGRIGAHVFYRQD